MGTGAICFCYYSNIIFTWVREIYMGVRNFFSSSTSNIFYLIILIFFTSTSNRVVEDHYFLFYAFDAPFSRLIFGTGEIFYMIQKKIYVGEENYFFSSYISKKNFNEASVTFIFKTNQQFFLSHDLFQNYCFILLFNFFIVA